LGCWACRRKEQAPACFSFQSFISLRFIKGFLLQSLTRFFKFETLSPNWNYNCARDASENPFACLLQKIEATARFLLSPLQERALIIYTISGKTVEKYRKIKACLPKKRIN
jgi:hypothetical protein